VSAVTGLELAAGEFGGEFDDGLDAEFAALAAECAKASRIAGALARWPVCVENAQLHRDGFPADVEAGDDAPMAVAGALRRVRREVEVSSAWFAFLTGAPVEAFCLVGSRRGANCGRPAGHDGEHVEPGPDGERWSDVRVGVVG
jgi:hypothetical protein